ncbi:MAG: aspartate aminotransferase family protein [Bryobacteraceae bacterium]|nr:aspartate aminotransferase family protein [Bryobacteraceae bacterium]
MTPAESRVRARTPGSLERYRRACRTLAGGVSSGLRRSAKPYPLFFDHGEGAEIVDVDGNRYIDYALAWGPLILGHAHPAVTQAVATQAARGLTFGAQHELEYEVAETLVRVIRGAERVAFANSGTEIVQVALRLARAVTGRTKVLKFEGHYHGWDDSVLVSYKPWREHPLESPAPAGQGQRPHDSVVIAQWNDLESVERALDDAVACVLAEPLLANNGCIPPEPGFLEFLRGITRERGALLIFDEVITGFRLALGGAQECYGVTPDLATYAKALGGGAPLSALTGRADLMDWIADGRVVHAGTLNGNPLSLAAAKATLAELERPGVYESLWRRGERLREAIETFVPGVVTNGGGPVFQVSFMEHCARNYRETLAADQSRYADFAMALLDRGVMVLPDGRWYLSTAHDDALIDRTIEVIRGLTTPGCG